MRFVYIVLIILVVLVVLAFVGVAPLAGYKDDVIAYVRSLSGSNSLGDASIQCVTDGYNGVVFDVQVNPDPQRIEYSTLYAIALCDHNGYLLDSVYTKWPASDFDTPSSSERTIPDLTKRLRNLQLTTQRGDKVIAPLLREVKQLYKEREQQALDDGGIGVHKDLFSDQVEYNLGKYALTAKDYQRIASKYVRLYILPAEEFGERLHDGILVLDDTGVGK
jgi:hypothetical protein